MRRTGRCPRDLPAGTRGESGRWAPTNAYTGVGGKGGYDPGDGTGRGRVDATPDGDFLGHEMVAPWRRWQGADRLAEYPLEWTVQTYAEASVDTALVSAWGPGRAHAAQ